MAKHLVKFYDQKGKCYFKSEAFHIDISTYTTVIDFSKEHKSEKTIFRSYDEMQQIEVKENFVLITFISGQRISICTQIC